eukprot:scaffold122549_cov42-Tisochrysis_lutea.AAC.1
MAAAIAADSVLSMVLVCMAQAIRAQTVCAGSSVVLATTSYFMPLLYFILFKVKHFELQIKAWGSQALPLYRLQFVVATCFKSGRAGPLHACLPDGARGMCWVTAAWQSQGELLEAYKPLHTSPHRACSDPSIAAHKQHRACVPQSHSTGDLSRSGSKQVNFHCAPSSCGLAISKERNRSTGDLGSSTSASGGPAAVAVAEHAREGLQPLAHDYSGREEGANPAYLEERMLGVLGLCNGGHQDVPPTSPVEIPTSRHNTDNKMLGSLSPGGVIPVSRLGSGSSSKAGRRSFHEGSRRLGNRNHGSHPLEGRRLGNNSTESSLRSIASSGSEHRLGSLDLGPLCNSLALQGCSLHAMGRARVLKEQHQQHHHHRQHHQHGPRGWQPAVVRAKLLVVSALC